MQSAKSDKVSLPLKYWIKSIEFQNFKTRSGDITELENSDEYFENVWIWKLFEKLFNIDDILASVSLHTFSETTLCVHSVLDNVYIGKFSSHLLLFICLLTVSWLRIPAYCL